MFIGRLFINFFIKVVIGFFTLILIVSLNENIFINDDSNRTEFCHYCSCEHYYALFLETVFKQWSINLTI